MIKRLFKFLIVVTSLAYAGVVCVLLASSQWPPEFWWCANLIQIAPLWVFLIPVVVLMLCALLVRARFSAALNALVLVIVFFGIMDFNISLPSTTGRVDRKRIALRLMSANLGKTVNWEALAGAVERTQPDVIAFQEVYSSAARIKSIVSDPSEWDIRLQEHLVVLSRLRIAHAEIKNRRFLGGWGGLVGKFVLVGEMGPFYLFNIHLESPREGIEALMGHKLDGIGQMQHVTDLQEKESAVVSKWVSSFDRTLVAGDFNMVVNNPIYAHYWGVLTNAFSKRGTGLGYTKYTRWHGVRIDHQLCDQDWRVVKSRIGPDIGSDHRPVISDFEFVGEVIEGGRIKDPGAQFEGRKILLFEPFEDTLGAFESYGHADVSLDSDPSFEHGNVLRVQIKTIAAQLAAGIAVNNWHIDGYPMVSFSYKIPRDVEMGIRVRTRFGDWLCVGGTPLNQCSDTPVREALQLNNDGQWHQVAFDVGAAVKSRVKAIKYLTAFEFYIPFNRHLRDTFWLDDFAIIGE